jgi:hypothetical protein
MRYVVYCLTYGRQAVTSACLGYLSRQIERLGLDISVVVMDSEESCREVIPEGFFYYNTRNKPLSLKAQEAINKCRELYPGSKGLIKVDSDDCLSDQQMLACADMLELGNTGQWNWLYVYALKADQCKSVNRVAPFGAGRVMSSSDLDTINWHVYRRELDRGLDAEAAKTFEQNGCDFFVFPNNPGEVILDLKSGYDVSKFSDYRGELVDPELVTRHFDWELQKEIENLKRISNAVS